MIVFNRHYKKTKIVTFSLALLYTVLPFIIPTDTLLQLTQGQPIFLSWNIFAFLLLFTPASPAFSIGFIVVFGLIGWFILYNLARFMFWLVGLFKRKEK